ncbi:MAG: hypothetical protein DRJ52_06920 [Thermoprotei archaeon]|nr:MAG: hypothetical protein DRJ52_06920 [Thermoprotei archaeon]RLE99903.1 MAG: hypothetical protein DRJ63_03890 [Thermoprotei archaeon]HDI75571.1 hypothetical protein [Thermoprotei archaeon]
MSVSMNIILELATIYSSAVLYAVLSRLKGFRNRKVAITWIVATYLLALFFFYSAFREYSVLERRLVYFGGGLFKAAAVDSLSLFINFIILSAASLMLIHSIQKIDLELKESGDFIALALSLIATTIFVTVSNNFLVFLILWEAATASVIGVLSFEAKKEESGEALIKMIFMALISSIFMLISIILIYISLTPYVKPSIITLNFDQAMTALSRVKGFELVLALLSFALIVAGLGIEIGLPPFYMWLPDVYTGSRPHAVSLMVLTLEVAGAYAIARIIGVYSLLPASLGVLTLPMLILIVFSILSILVGEASALVQRKLRRILGYSAVADAGYIVLLSLFFVSLKTPPIGETASYALPLAYFIAVSNISLATAVALIGLVEERGVDTLDSARGLVREDSLLTVMTVICIMSVFGVPPLAGFIAKFFVISAIASTANQVLVYVAVIAAILFVVSAAYGLRIVQYFCVYEREKVECPRRVCRSYLVPLMILVCLLLLAGIYPPLITFLFM